MTDTRTDAQTDNPVQGPVNIYDNTGPESLQQDQRLLFTLHHIGLRVILNVDDAGLPAILMLDFNGAKDYLKVLSYGAMGFYWPLY